MKKATASQEYNLRRAIRFTRRSSDQMTPWNVAVQMVDSIPKHLFNTQALVPGSGFGSFALALIYRGWDPAKITCVEIDPGFALLTSKRSPDIKTINTDFLSWSASMKFDVVIGNPPYQNGKNSNFYVQFIERSAELLKPGGYFSYLIPNRFTLPHTPAAKVLVKYFQLTKLHANVSSWFPKIGTTIGWVTGFRSDNGHTGTVPITLLDGTIADIDPTKLCVPSKKPDVEGMREWSKIAETESYNVTRRKPETDNYVFMRRQWRSSGGRVYIDAVVGDHPEGHTDGAYIVTDHPQSVADHLRGDVGPAIHKLFGDQMNIWPCLWQHLPTKAAWEKQNK